jgi:cation:H+ antiporter
MGDIGGGNAFLSVLSILVPFISGKAVLPQAQASDLYLSALGALLSLVYVVRLVFPQTAVSCAWARTRWPSW